MLGFGEQVSLGEHASLPWAFHLNHTSVLIETVVKLHVVAPKPKIPIPPNESQLPYVGAITGFVIGVTLAFLQFDDLIRVAAVALVFVIGQVLEGNFLSPKLVGERVGLHPVWVIFGAFAGAALFGLVGILIAVPATAVIGVLVRFAIERYETSILYLGGDEGGDGGGEPSS